MWPDPRAYILSSHSLAVRPRCGTCPSHPIKTTHLTPATSLQQDMDPAISAPHTWLDPRSRLVVGLRLVGVKCSMHPKSRTCPFAWRPSSRFEPSRQLTLAAGPQSFPRAPCGMALSKSQIGDNPLQLAVLFFKLSQPLHLRAQQARILLRQL